MAKMAASANWRSSENGESGENQWHGSVNNERKRRSAKWQHGNIALRHGIIGISGVAKNGMAYQRRRHLAAAKKKAWHQ